MVNQFQTERLGERIREARESRRQSQRDVAILLGCDTATVWRWETGATKPTGIFRRLLGRAYPELLQ